MSLGENARWQTSKAPASTYQIECWLHDALLQDAQASSASLETFRPKFLFWRFAFVDLKMRNNIFMGEKDYLTPNTMIR
jgi:hypothetical protein